MREKKKKRKKKQPCRRRLKREKRVEKEGEGLGPRRFSAVSTTMHVCRRSNKGEGGVRAFCASYFSCLWTSFSLVERKKGGEKRKERNLRRLRCGLLSCCRGLPGLLHRDLGEKKKKGGGKGGKKKD